MLETTTSLPATSSKAKVKAEVKLPAHSAGLPGNDSLLDIVPLDPVNRAGLAGHLPVKDEFSPFGLERICKSLLGV